MASRVDKYYIDNGNSGTLSTRSSRNARLYKEVYGKYDDLDNLPIEDNTDEIDMEKLKELVLSSNREKKVREYNNNSDFSNIKKRNIDEKRVYDINKMLEKAKYENSKLKDSVTTRNLKISSDILSTLENSDITIEDIRKDAQKYEKKFEDKDDELSMTRELKFKNLSLDNIKENSNEFKVMPTNDLSLDLFSDLKPTENTVVTKPISNTNSINVTKDNFHSSDTSDIDVIKTQSNKKIDNDFFTSSYEFSKKDFTSDDDFDEDSKSSGLVKILLLFLFIGVLVGVIIYFIYTYGLGS